MTLTKINKQILLFFLSCGLFGQKHGDEGTYVAVANVKECEVDS